MPEQPQDQPKTMTRRSFLVGATAVGVGGLVVGGVAGGLIGASTGESGSTTSNTSSGSGEPIVIGSSQPLTGFAAADGAEQKNALELAVKEWNARGGVLGREITTVIEDVADMAPETMLGNFRSLIDKSNVDVIIDGYLLYSGPEYDVVAESGTLYIHVNTLESNPVQYASDPEKYWMAYMADPPQKFYGLGFPQFVDDVEASGKWKPANKKIAIISASDPYAVGIAEACQTAMKEYGWTISMFEKIVAPLNEWGPILTKIRADVPDWIFIADLTLGDIASFTKAFADNPTKSLVYGQYVPSLTEYINLTGAASNGVVWSTVCGTWPGQLRDQFNAAYEAEYGKPPGGSIGGILYDEVNLYLTAVATAASTDDRKVADVLDNIWYRGITGMYRFTDRHDVLPYPDVTPDLSAGQPHLFTQIQDGKQVIIYPKPCNEGDFILPAWM